MVRLLANPAFWLFTLLFTWLATVTILIAGGI